MAAGDKRAIHFSRRKIRLALLVLLFIIASCSDPVGNEINVLRTGSLSDKEKAMEKLVAIGVPAIKPLIAALNDPDKIVCEYAGLALVKIGEPAISPLIAALKDPSSDVRLGALVALVKIGGTRALEPLIAALQDPIKDVRDYADLMLVKIGEPAVSLLIAALKDQLPYVRRDAAEVLVKIGEPAVSPLIGALKDQHPYVRQHAAEVLGKIGGARALEPLIAALKDQNPDFRMRAALALGKIGDTRAVEPLIAALKDSYPGVRENAAHALCSQTSLWSLAKKILWKDVQSGNKVRIEYAVFAFIGIGNEEIIPELKSILWQKGDKNMAEVYLNCGHNELEKAAKEWGALHGYQIVPGGGSARVGWGRP